MASQLRDEGHSQAAATTLGTGLQLALFLGCSMALVLGVCAQPLVRCSGGLGT